MRLASHLLVMKPTRANSPLPSGEGGSYDRAVVGVGEGETLRIGIKNMNAEHHEIGALPLTCRFIR